MRLAEFIQRHRDEIIGEWEAFAGTMQPAAGEMSQPELREHARELLDAAAHDLDSAQTSQEQGQKAKGLGTERRMALVAQKHAMRRLNAGFRLQQVLAEYRALRATVVSLWAQASCRPSATRQRDLTRFHEAIDEALTESVNRYATQVDEYREQFLAVLGHDLRNPLGAISMLAASLSRATDMTDNRVATARQILVASGRMVRLVNDLLELTRAKLGEGITIKRQATELRTLSRQVVGELETIHPGRRLILECKGDVHGSWDSDRLAQIISNLVANALQHGDATAPVTIRAASGEGTARLTVHNHGGTIPPAWLKTIFDPTVRSSEGQRAGQPPHLGLGLFIVRELVRAHGGTVGVTSTQADGTTFTVSLPKHERSARRPPRPARSRAHNRPALGRLPAPT